MLFAMSFAARVVSIAAANGFPSDMQLWALTTATLVVVLVLVIVQAFRNHQRMRQRLDRAEHMESLGRLAGGVAHDFNNMLAGMLGASELALDHTGDNDALRYQLELIRGSATRAADLTRALLTFSRRNTSMLALLDLHVLLDNVLALISRSVDRRIAVHKTFAAADHAALGDVAQLQNAFLNLCVNARDAMPDGGTLTVVTRNRIIDQAHYRHTELSPGNYIEISVTDTGTGIPQHALIHIFEPFYTTKEAGKGSGMGLSAVYGTVKNHHGSIDVSSSMGRGTVFTLRLPVARSPQPDPTLEAPFAVEASDAEPPAETAGSAPERTLNVLVVDDEPAVREVTVGTLNTLGHHAVGAAESDEALNTIRASKTPFDLAIVDMVMPNLTGPECAQAIWRERPDIRVIFSSGFSHQHVGDLMASGKTFFFIQKPFGRKTLRHTIHRAMNDVSEHGGA